MAHEDAPAASAEHAVGQAEIVSSLTAAAQAAFDGSLPESIEAYTHLENGSHVRKISRADYSVYRMTRDDNLSLSETIDPNDPNQIRHYELNCSHAGDFNVHTWRWTDGGEELSYTETMLYGPDLSKKTDGFTEEDIDEPLKYIATIANHNKKPDQLPEKQQPRPGLIRRIARLLLHKS